MKHKQEQHIHSIQKIIEISVINQTFIRCLDNELKTAALKHANHKQTPRESEMPFKALVDKIDQKDLTRTITNNHKRLYEVNQTTTNINEDLKQIDRKTSMKI